jgi:NAD dependent epimerase/dehydratase family enzyme
MYLFFFGFTGLIGSNIFNHFANLNYFKKIFLFTRRSNLDPIFNNFNNIEIIKYSELNTDLINKIINTNSIEDKEFIVFNFVGENIFGYINKSKYEKIYKSRVEFNKKLVNIFNSISKRPYIFFSASAIGYYSNLIDIEEPIDEKYFLKNNIENSSLMSKLCLEWEKVTHELEGSNVFNLRLGVVLDKDALFVKMLKINSYLGVGLTFDDPFLPWIYSKEIPLIIEFLINYTKNNNLNSIKQPINVVNPNILRFSEFLKILIKKYRKLPINLVIKIPRSFVKLITKLLMGKYYEIPFSLLISLNIKPNFLLNTGYNFRYNYLEELDL